MVIFVVSVFWKTREVHQQTLMENYLNPFTELADIFLGNL